MNTEKQTHYGFGSRRRKFDYYTMRVNPDGTVDVLGWGIYESYSVLAGQSMKKFLGNFADEKAAKAVYGDDMNFSSQWTEPGNSYSHLPGEDDFVPGGAYPDDIYGAY